MASGGPDAVAEDGLIEDSTGVTATGYGADTPPLASVTVRWKFPERARMAGVMAAPSSVALATDVPRGVPAQFTTDDGMKPEPVTVITKVGPPASSRLGEAEVIAGAARMVKGTSAEAPAPAES